MKQFLLATGTAILLQNPAAWGQSEPRTGKPSTPGSDRAAESVRVVPRPRPPQPSRFTVTVSTNRDTYRIGESVRVRFRASRDAYVYIYSSSPGGETRQIFPNYWDRDNFVQAGVTYSIPDGSYDLVAEPPAGRETISIIALREQFRTLDRFRRFSQSDPFPSAAGRKAEIRSVVPRERRNEMVAEDSTTIRIVGGGRQWERPLPGTDPRYLW